MKKASKIIDGLRDAGHRITSIRSETLSIFVNSLAPVTAADVIDQMRANRPKLNKTTIYRELDFLKKEGLLLELDFLDGKKRYELRKPDDHHHHLVCTSCKDIQCVALPDDLKSLEAKISRQHGFQISSHVLEFFGTCRRCR